MADLMIQKRVHKLRSKAFYQLMKEEPLGTKSFCFDLQQVQPLPKLNIQQAYYSRQFSYFSLCCVDIQTKSPTFYSWVETQAGRGANEVASGVISFPYECSA